MNNKLKSFKVKRKVVTFEVVTIQARDEKHLWQKMDKHQGEDGKEYDWEFLDSESEYEIVN